ncbi:hypothetical protein C0Q70_05777 [Pomacea canaliculata]|uniref:STI1 domain-containing protein n=1 Tax=Pomacea canaliculata TaxID=400727 RepID=A0A2T7PM76_POMCA|nr:hypothetical protein C0Q70_05777 [Pomacea canaliculata]
MDSSQLSLLRKFVEMCKADSNILHVADLAFYREYLESLGARIPPHRATDPVNEEAKSSKPTQKPPEPEPEEEEEEEIESDVELDNTGVITDEDEDMPEYADINTEVTDDMIDQASDKRNAAMDAAGEGWLHVYLKMNKPKKAIHDSTKAIELNPDSAQGYKWRGKAQKMLGNWEDAYHDLTLAGKLDFDDDINEALHAVTPNAKKLMEHKRKYERIREEKELKKRKERIRKAREEYEKQKEEQSHHEGPTGGFPGFPGAFPGSTGGMPGMPDMASLLQDPELLAAFQDPEVSAAFQDVAANPANISKYQNNPRVQSVINKLAAKFGTGGSGMGRGGMGEGKVKSSEEKEIIENYAVNPDYIPVAVKVLHPDVRENFGCDLSLMRVMSQILEMFIPTLRWVNLAECVKEFSIAMTKQMNMVQEARCLKQFREDFSKFQCIRFPLPILDLTHEDILVESFEEGQPLSDFIDESVDTPLELKKQIADIGTDALFHMVFVKNFVHGDLHPGNILVQNAAEYSKEAYCSAPAIPDTFFYLKAVGAVMVKGPLHLVFLDCGITASLGETDHEKFMQVFTAVVKGEGERVADLFLEKSQHVECVDPDTFRKDMAHIVNSARETALQLSKFKVSQLLSDLFSLLSKHRVKMESNFATIIIAIAIVEGIGRSLDPELDILSKAKRVLLGEFIKFKHHV